MNPYRVGSAFPRQKIELGCPPHALVERTARTSMSLYTRVWVCITCGQVLATSTRAMPDHAKDPSR